MFIRDDVTMVELDPYWILKAVQLSLFVKSYNPVGLKLALFGA